MLKKNSKIKLFHSTKVWALLKRMFKGKYFIKHIIKMHLISLFNRLENNNDTNFCSNGEKIFIDLLFNYFCKLSRENLILFDIGANIGEYSKILFYTSKKFKINVKIHCFEPTSSCYDELLIRYGGGNNSFILNKMACSNSDGNSLIFYDEKKSGLASLYKRNLGFYSINLDKNEKVDTIRLDNYIKREKIIHIDFMKIDVEGHELAVLEGLSSYLDNNFIDFIQFEYGGANLDSKTCLLEFFDIFESRGFLVAKIMKNRLDIRKFEQWMENFQYCNYVAISKKIINYLYD